MNFNLNISPEELEQIEHYLQGQMTAAEKQSFEMEVAASADLQDKVQQVQLLMLGVQEAELSSKLNRFHKELPAAKKSEAKTVSLFSTKRWMAAAAIVFVLALGTWFLLFRKSSNEKLYAAYFRPDPGLMTTMGTTDNYTFDRAMVDYKTSHYEEAITAWKSLLKNAPQNDTLNYFIGAALQAKGQSAESISYLQKIIAQPQSYFRPDAYWYLGLALLKEGKKEEAVAAIRQSNHPQKEVLLQALSK